MTRHEAVLYVYHDNPQMCASRVRLLRALNPGVHLYGIYGGEAERFDDFAETNRLLDDAWCCTTGTGKWRWMNMDKVIGLWYTARGQHLPWDVILEHQADLLVASPITEWVKHVPTQRDILFYHAPRTYHQLVLDKWPWAVAGLSDLKAFMVWLHHHYPGTRFCGASILFTVCTRAYVHEYNEVIADIPGVMEYRATSMARALGYRFIDFELPEPHRAWTSFSKVPLEAAAVISELERPDGARMFHRVNDPIEPHDLPAALLPPSAQAPS